MSRALAMSTNVRFHCTQSHARVARFLPTKTKGSGRARALLHHPATPPRIVLTQPFMICVSNEYMRTRVVLEVREGHPEDRTRKGGPKKGLTRGVAKPGTCVTRGSARSPAAAQVDIVIAARPEPRSSRTVQKVYNRCRFR